MNPVEAIQLVTLACAARPTPASFLDMTAIEGMATMWRAILADVPYEDAEAALVVLLAGPTCDGKLPEPGQIRRVIDEAINGRRRPGGDAWGEFRNLFTALAGRRAPRAGDTQDPVLLAVIERMGWSAWGETDSSAARAAYRSQFISLYDQLAATWTQARVVAQLPAAQHLASLAGQLGRELAMPPAERAAAPRQLPAAARKAGSR